MSIIIRTNWSQQPVNHKIDCVFALDKGILGGWEHFVKKRDNYRE